MFSDSPFRKNGLVSFLHIVEDSYRFAYGERTLFNAMLCRISEIFG
jgi:hypothetical protein